MFVGVFLVSGKWIEKLCVSSALPFVECVVVWALKLPVPHTNVLKPTRRKAFLFIYRKLKRYEHLTLTTNQLVESSFLCFQDNSFYLLKGKELHRNRRPICTESFAGKMVGARVKCSLSVPLDSSNSGEKLCDSWVQTRGYEACVFCMPIPLRVC